MSWCPTATERYFHAPCRPPPRPAAECYYFGNPEEEKDDGGEEEEEEEEVPAQHHVVEEHGEDHEDEDSAGPTAPPPERYFACVAPAPALPPPSERYFHHTRARPPSACADGADNTDKDGNCLKCKDPANYERKMAPGGHVMCQCTSDPTTGRPRQPSRVYFDGANGAPRCEPVVERYAPQSTFCARPAHGYTWK